MAIAAVDFINVGHQFDTLTDDEEDNDHDENPRHTALLNNGLMSEANQFYSPFFQPRHS